MNNRSSVAYNILSNSVNKRSGFIVQGIFDKKISNRKKGVVEFEDRIATYAVNENKKFLSVFSENNNIFKNYKGIFTNMYDASHRNGNIVVPFKNDSKKQ